MSLHVKEHNDYIKSLMQTKLKELDTWNKMYKDEHSITFEYYMEMFTQTMNEYNNLQDQLLNESDKRKFTL